MKELHNYVFATHKKLTLGPGQYNSNVSQTKHRSPAIRLTEDPALPRFSVEQEDKAKSELKMMRLFDGSSASIKHIRPSVSIPELEARSIVKDFLD